MIRNESNVNHLSSGMHAEVPQGSNLGNSPAVAFAPVGESHVVGVVVAEFEKIVLLWFGVQLVAGSTSNLQVFKLKKALSFLEG